MKFLLVVFFLVNGTWVEGEASKGWGPFPYESEAKCLESKARAEGIFAQLLVSRPRAIKKRFECIAEQTESND